MSTGLSRFQTHKRIAEDLNTSRATVYRRLTPGFKQKELEYLKEYKVKKKRRQYYKKYYKKNKQKISSYHTRYMGVYGHLDSIVSNTLMEDEELSSTQISKKLYEAFGFKIREKTIQKLLGSYQKQSIR